MFYPMSTFWYINFMLNLVVSLQRDLNTTEFANVKPTGKSTNDTRPMMKIPRCGNEDHDLLPEQLKDNLLYDKRYILQGSKYTKKDLTYDILEYTKKLDKDIVDKEIEKAFELWSERTPLRFQRDRSGRKTDIEIRFVRGDHGDRKPFDGPSGTLAHAYYPPVGKVHFDEDEDWSSESEYGTNLYQVAVHEFGHVLGLYHSQNLNSLMAPYYRGYRSNLKLYEDDIEGIQAIYGKRDSNSAPSQGSDLTPVQKSQESEICNNPTFDVIIRLNDGKTYVFKGKHYYKLGDTEGVLPGYPKRIDNFLPGLPDNIDAALNYKRKHAFFFKGDMVWKYRGGKLGKKYPKLISELFIGIPDNLDAAFYWPQNRKIYFFKGSLYWQFSPWQFPPVDESYPRKINSFWQGVPSNLSSVFTWSNGRTYFFKNDVYYRLNDDYHAVDNSFPEFPRSVSKYWLNCY